MKKGYLIAVCDDSESYIPNAEHIERDDLLMIYESDLQAAKAAESDGIKLIYDVKNVEDGIYIDTSKNREIIQSYINNLERNKLMSKLLVTLEIEIQNQTDDGIIKIDDEIKSAIRLYEHDILDGFEITTVFDDCDNTSDFFLKDANIVSIKTEKEMEYLQKLKENEMFSYEDLQLSIVEFYKLNHHFKSESLNFSEWVRAVHEINEDFEERIIDVTENVCNSLKTVEETYGYDIAKEIYDEKMAILPNEITEVGKYLSLGGDREKVNELLNGGFFMDNKTHDEMQRFIESHEPSAPVMSM